MSILKYSLLQHLNSLFMFMARPAMLAFYVWGMLVLFLPDYFQKYRTEIIDLEYLPDYMKIYYRDLNGDGISEKIVTGYNRAEGQVKIQHYSLDGKVYDQWMPKGKWFDSYTPAFGDYNNNGFTEIYCLTIHSDSIFLSIKELMLNGGLEVKNRFICKTGLYDGSNYDIVNYGGWLLDNGRNNLKDYVFDVYGGYSKFPRNIFLYQIQNDSLTMSPVSASGIRVPFSFMDLNGDGINEVTGMMSSPENVHYPMPYTDSAVWLMVINPANMKFLFPPKRFDCGIGADLRTVFYSVYNKKIIATSIRSIDAESEIDYLQLKLFDNLGNLLKNKHIDQSTHKILFFLPQVSGDSTNLYLCDHYGNIFKTDTNLNIQDYFYSGLEEMRLVDNYKYFHDLDNDGEQEMIFITENKTADVYLLIYRKNLKELTTVKLEGIKGCFSPHLEMMVESNNSHPIMSVQSGNNVFKITYHKSGLYAFKYPFYIAGYFLILLFFWLLQKAQNVLAQKKLETEKQLVRQQLAISKNQLEPHFMLNILNHIGMMFAYEDKEKAQYYFAKFASLIRRGLTYADKTETSLKEELEFVADYLTLQERRFTDFSFTIQVEKDINTNDILIPHSLIYTFAENALVHGLFHQSGIKTLSIDVKRTKDHTTITITDNGIGRKRASELKTSGTRKGLGIVNTMITNYNKLYNRSISFKTIDLTDDKGANAGTAVQVRV